MKMIKNSAKMLKVYIWRGGGGTFPIFGKPGSAHNKRFDPRIYGFVKMRSQKDLRSMKMGVNWIENQGENLYKMLKKC